jgi:hypothetical protein
VFGLIVPTAIIKKKNNYTTWLVKLKECRKNLTGFAFFDVEEKNITNNSGGLQVQIYDVCNLLAFGNSEDIKYGKCYKHSPKN